MALNILGQALTFISYAVFWFSRFFDNKKKLLIYDNISRIVAIISFISLGSLNGVQNTLFVIVRNYCGQITDKKSVKIKGITFVLLLITLVIMYAISFNGILTIALFICSVLNLIGVIFCNEQGIRLFGLSGGLFYAMFLFMIHNYIGFICEIIGVIVIFSSYLMYKNK